MEKRGHHILVIIGTSVILLSAIILIVHYRYGSDLETITIEKNNRLQESQQFEDFTGNPDQPEVALGQIPGELLPDLQVKPLEDAYVTTSQNRRVLRFPATFTNTGDGPLELIGISDEENGITQAFQRIYGKDGPEKERHVGNFVFHETHDHWHFEDFVEFELFALDETGGLDRKLSGTGKMTFCIHDYEPLAGDIPGKPTEVVYPRCVSADIQGISVGWADTYLADVPGQELDIEDIPDGTYAFRAVVDPDNRIRETDENNNSSITYIGIEGDVARILSGFPDQ